ncbi:ribosomal RNA small subunit methyltransferase H [Clostridium sp. CAG:557]|jgi:16S rRNA (cytosine1402-N4)-methyltransferase|nr:ribosomal RNA small subunit methyltransferase H [Clostridium sp. CAG:557]
MNFSHIPVLLSEAIDGLAIDESGIYIDGTAGGGSHSEAILKRLKSGKLVSIDQDPDAIEFLKKKLSPYKNSILVQDNFSNMDKIVKGLSIDAVNGILLDIGVSSHQFDTPGRGFSYRYDAPLDMRMSQEGKSAADLVNGLSWQELAKIISTYSEEKFAKNIALAIVKERENSPIKTTGHLSEVIKSAIPAKFKRDGGHPARKTFQALRIAVNNELDVLTTGLDAAFSILKPGGRLAVITFHSLEDRLVKKKMAAWCEGCTCPPEFPICVCHKKPQAKLINKKVIEASPREVNENPRSRSAKLRICEKL